MVIKEDIIFKRSKKGKKAFNLPQKDDIKTLFEKYKDDIREYTSEDFPNLPELSEVDIIRHFIRLSNMNYNVDLGFYPLGSCTMKYNPKINETVSAFSGFRNIHPLQPDYTVQGALRIMYELSEYLAEISGMDAITLEPAAGAHGELTGIKIIKKYLESKGEKRKYILVPDSAHGTNPASTTLAGYTAKTIKSNKLGMIDIEELRKNLNDEVAGLMVTNPNTLGIFEREIKEIAELVHKAGGLMYMDGANLNALLGYIRPGDIGFDVIHFNLHKTFSTPHGGGGPGSGPVGVKAFLKDFLPGVQVIKNDSGYQRKETGDKSIGKLLAFFGHFAVMVRAYTYIRMIGKEHLKSISENAVLNANYLKQLLKVAGYEIPYDSIPMHEFVATGAPIKKKYGIRTLDIAKRLLDYGVHAPTVYFPLIVSEALMIEPTETESVETLEYFAEVMKKILKEAEHTPEIVKTAPHNTPVKRLDDVYAVKNLKVKYEEIEDKNERRDS